MFGKDKTINSIVAKKIENDNNTNNLRNQLKDSCKKSVIVFVDLCKSTDLKQDKEDIDWLCDIYSFINEVQNVGFKNHGTIIKRIGDEIMLEFSSVNNAEDFLTDLDSSDLLSNYDFKIGCDYGDVFYFYFDNSVDDPYGTTVDRCARVIGLARGSVILVSEYYRNELDEEKRNNYIHLGNFNLKGIKNAIGIYARNVKHESEEFFEPLIKKLNAESVSGFHYISRKFEKEYFSEVNEYNGKPFLLRYLLNIPKRNESLERLFELKDDKNKIKEYIGYIYEGCGCFLTYTVCVECKYIVLTLALNKEEQCNMISLYLPFTYLEIVKQYKQNDKICFEGVFLGIQTIFLDFDYVEFK